MDGMAIQGIVIGVEYTGAEQIASLQIDDTEETIVVCLPANGPVAKLGALIRVTVPLSEIHLFDALGQRREFEPIDLRMSQAA